MTDTDDRLPRQVERLYGTVVRRLYGHGSKSERMAILLETDDGLLLMRRRGGPSFGETGLEPWVGKQVHCWGTVVGQLLLIDRVLSAEESHT